jgi:hypothetical protein
MPVELREAAVEQSGRLLGATVDSLSMRLEIVEGPATSVNTPVIRRSAAGIAMNAL